MAAQRSLVSNWAAGIIRGDGLLFLFLSKSRCCFYVDGHTKILQFLDVHVYLAFSIELVIVILSEILEWDMVSYDVVDCDEQ